MKRILLDCDGVLADFCAGFLKLVNAQFGTTFVPTDITDYDIAKALRWSPERAEEAYALITNCDRFAARLDPMPGAQTGVRRLLELGEVYVVTSPWWSNETWCHDRTNWLYEHFGIGAGRVVHTAAKRLVAGDILVDDKTSTCEAWRAAWPQGVAVLWSTPQNRRDLWDGPCTSDWSYLADLVRATP